MKLAEEKLNGKEIAGERVRESSQRYRSSNSALAREALFRAEKADVIRRFRARGPFQATGNLTSSEEKCVCEREREGLKIRKMYFTFISP